MRNPDIKCKIRTLNVNPDMAYFDGIIPCGIFELGVTSLKEKGIEISVEYMAEKIMFLI